MDLVDITNKNVDFFTEAVTSEIRRKAAEIPAGAPGICEVCGEYSGRLVNDSCAPCRDEYNLR